VTTTRATVDELLACAILAARDDGQHDLALALAALARISRNPEFIGFVREYLVKIRDGVVQMDATKN
jgi:hypothetical protein